MGSIRDELDGKKIREPWNCWDGKGSLSIHTLLPLPKPHKLEQNPSMSLEAMIMFSKWCLL